MNKHFLLFAWLLFSVQLNAQTGIGTITPNPSAKLDVYSTNKGFLPPRVTLTSATDASTIASPAEGLLVYNLGSVGLQAGYYYWNGANWATIATANSAGNGVTAMDMVKLYYEVYSTTSGKAPSSTGYTFTVPVSGRYEFNFNSTGYSTTTNIKLTFNIREGTNVLASDYHQSSSSNVWAEYEGRLEVNLTAGVTYNAQIVTSSGNRTANYDWDKIVYKLIAGNLPVTGQTVDYVSVTRTASDQTVNTGNTVVFNTINGGNIPYNTSTGLFTLTAGKTYKLTGVVSLSNGNTVAKEVNIVWKNAAGDVLGSKGELLSPSAAVDAAGNGTAFAIYTPTSNTTVSLIVNYSSSNTILWQNFTFASIEQIGSSAIVNPWVLSGNDVYNTTGRVGIGNTSPNAKLDVRSSPTSTTDPGAGFIGLGTTTVSASSAGAGALRFNTSSDLIEFSNGTSWLSLAPGNTPMYAQFRANASQTFNAAGGKMNFPNTYINVGGFSISGNNTITLPAGRIYRIDLNLGWASLNYARFAIYDASSGNALSTTAHLEGAANGAYAGSGTTTTFVNTTSGSIMIDVRYVAPAGTNALLGDTGNGTNFPTITIQAVD